MDTRKDSRDRKGPVIRGLRFLSYAAIGYFGILLCAYGLQAKLLRENIRASERIYNQSPRHPLASFNYHYSIPIESSFYSTAITFGDNVGTLTWKNGYLEFHGKADKSFKNFFNYIKPDIDSYIQAELNKPKKYVYIRDEKPFHGEGHLSTGTWRMNEFYKATPYKK